MNNRFQRRHKPIYHFMVERLDKFKYIEDTENTLRLTISNESDTETLGANIGNAIKDIRISGIYLYGKYKIGKSTLANSITNNLNQKVTHIDFFSKRYTGKPVKKIELSENEILIAEWPEVLEDNAFEENRLEIEFCELKENESITEKSEVLIYNKSPENRTLYVTMIGYGNGIELLKKVKEQYNA